MKKYILSFVFIVSFTVYALYQQLNMNSASTISQDGGVVAVATPTPTGLTNTPTPSNTVTGAPTPTSVPTKNPTPTPTPKGQYTDGTYTGVSSDAIYGNIQVRAVISGGKLTDVVFLDYPQDRDRSIRINQEAMPILKQEAIAAQSAKVNGVSGATDSSDAFVRSLSSALQQAKS